MAEKLSTARPSPVDKPVVRKGRRKTEGAAGRVQQESGQVQTRRLRRKTTGEDAVPVKDRVGSKSLRRKTTGEQAVPVKVLVDPKSQAANRRTKVTSANQVR